MMTVKRKTTQTTQTKPTQTKPTAQRLAPVSAASRGGRAIPLAVIGEAVRHRRRRPQRNRARTKDASHA
ncbi:hypothetical protein [Burkholderia pseudomallei]|uniref:hypothetical protein n=2 Tax=Burkholderia pseudomallei TaxID=28450 RepID=UPI000538E373|nr:hypothetical protein [Burkholderia pseudomallei]KGW42930.1 hypothetical protein Y597_3174 [Burkholderia pseudomallei MSHR1000]ONC53561.1 hypothetical protein AQ919_23515 [Burkholderia pseudomallei]ONC72727.1 hypothetical protein AQ921_13270 [Burkholderia pseudomallei]